MGKVKKREGAIIGYLSNIGHLLGRLVPGTNIGHLTYGKTFKILFREDFLFYVSHEQTCVREMGI